MLELMDWVDWIIVISWTVGCLGLAIALTLSTLGWLEDSYQD